jgi:SAM-dependent methyltransferase
MNGRIYDALTSRIERSVFGPLRASLLSPLRGRIVDVGAGTGVNFPYYGRGADVIALEPDPGMRRRAARRIAAAAATIDLRAEADDALETFETGSVDAVVFTLGLCTIPNPLRSLERAKRILKPAGTIVILEHVRGTGWAARVQDAVAPAWSCAFGGCRLNQDTRALLERAGLDTSAVERHRIGAFSLVGDLIAGVSTRGAAAEILNNQA